MDARFELELDMRRVGRKHCVVNAMLLAIVAFCGCQSRSETALPQADSRKEAVSNSSAKVRELQQASFYKNAHPDVKYVGSAACLECHAEHDASFRHTGMGRSSALVDLDREPPDGQFDHAVSKRRFQVARRDGQLWHRELLLHDGTDEVVLSEHPMKYVIGSGRHSLTYVYEDDGFLMESPITWYTSRKAWGMSPGYDRPNHSGFEREVGENCLVCHVGNLEPLHGTMHKVRIDEPTIACEQCHGPGSLHVERRVAERKRDAKATPPAAADQLDDTIVNPRRLTRELSEAICEQCHLRSAAAIVARGASLRDFRPSLLLDDFHHVYRLEPPDDQMTVVGHVEQMNLSRCYQASSDFTCLTCHSPHAEDKPRGDTRHYNAICQKCHSLSACGMPEEDRRKASADDHCIQCHMPKSDTDIPHLAFTHHRVGIHPSAGEEGAAGAKGKAKSQSNETAILVPFREQKNIDVTEQSRALGLAYLDAATREDNLRRRARFQQRSIELLSQYRAANTAPDGVVDSWIARARFDFGLNGVRPLAERALADESMVGFDRCNALFLLADAQFGQGQYRESLSTLAQLHPLRRHSLQWLLEAQCAKNMGDEVEMERALLKAVRINPGLGNVHRALADLYRKRGEEEKANWHERRVGAGVGEVVGDGGPARQ